VLFRQKPVDYSPKQFSSIRNEVVATIFAIGITPKTAELKPPDIIAM
jgi:hypothetical protein